MIKKIIILIILVFLASNFFYWRGINAVADEKGSDAMFLIAKGESVDTIGENLQEAGLIKSKFYFKIYIKRNEEYANLKAGEYTLNSRLSVKEIVKVLASGETLSKEDTIKIIEGWDIRDIASYFENIGRFQSKEILEVVDAPLSSWDRPLPDFLNDAPKSATLEGYLFPDTYRIFKDSTVAEIASKILKNFDNKLTEEMRAEIKKQDKRVFDIIKMASILEREVRTYDDMKIVSGIFWDRIKNGQGLQSDATLSYYLRDKNAAHTTDDLKIDTPYNTYKYRGLPPTPICNPGLNAIKAAIYPEYTDYNYFLNRQDTGETIFSKTYEEHIRNKNKYLK